MQPTDRRGDRNRAGAESVGDAVYPSIHVVMKNMIITIIMMIIVITMITIIVTTSNNK